MNGVLNTGLNFWQVIVSILVAVFSFIAIRISLNFDINKYLERRDKKNTLKLKNACTHLVLVPTEDKQFQYQSLFESPSGTLQWQCQRCGLVRNHDNDCEDRAKYYINHPKEYAKMNKKFAKLLKKSGIN